MTTKKRTVRYNQNEIDNYFDLGVDRKRRVIYLGSFGSPEDGRERGVDNMMAEFLVKGFGHTKHKQKKDNC